VQDLKDQMTIEYAMQINLRYAFSNLFTSLLEWEVFHDLDTELSFSKMGLSIHGISERELVVNTVQFLSSCSRRERFVLESET